MKCRNGWCGAVTVDFDNTCARVVCVMLMQCCHVNYSDSAANNEDWVHRKWSLTNKDRPRAPSESKKPLPRTDKSKVLGVFDRSQC
jgi:hypothetical protein